MSGCGNIDIVRQLYGAFERGDVDVVLSLLHDDITWDFPGPREIPYTGTYQGRERVREFFEEIGASVSAEAFTVERCVADGDVVVAVGHERMRLKATGRTFEMQWADVFDLREGKIVRFREYTDTGAILKAYLDIGEERP